MSKQAQGISVIAELERAAVKFEWSGDDEVKICCPFHHDDNPSCDVNVKKKMFRCKAAGCPRNKGDFITLLTGITKRTRAAVLEELGTRYDLADVKIIEPDVIERWHQQIWLAGPLLAELLGRLAMIPEDIIKYKLGEHEGRVAIPITNDRGDYVNARLYLPGAPSAEKMRNLKGRGAARLFPIEQMGYPTVMICGGEAKAIVAARYLNPHGIGAVCMTQNEELLPRALLERFRGKVVYVCMDIDEHGRAASEKNCSALEPLCPEVYDFILPLDIGKHPKGDVNDFVREGGNLWEAMQKCEKWVRKTRLLLQDEEPIPLHLSEAVNADYAAKRASITGVVAAMDTAPYVVPREVVVSCNKDQVFCAVCPVWSTTDARFEVHPEHPAILQIVAASKRSMPEALQEATGIPRACRVCEFRAESYYNAEDVRLTPQLEITERAADQRMQPAICIGHGLELNESYQLVGRMYPHPLTQQSTLLISKYEPTRDALSTYAPKDLERLIAFRPHEWTVDGIQTKLDEIYDDFERHVTRIRQRRDMHVVVDLVYHSPLLFIMDDRIVKGWVEGLIIGDSAQGKSETALFMMKHYGLGERLECKNATVAGLLGGLQQVGNGRWFVTWGFIPSHDKRLVILEELKGTSIEVISKLTDMRSSGIAELTKIEKRRTHARTRILGISNARFDRSIDSYGFGIEAVLELIGAKEDVRRFDIVQIVEKSEVDSAEINRLNGSFNGDPARFEKDLCRGLVLWAWTRQPHQVIISKETATLAMEFATEMCEEFTDAIPIVDRGSMRYKIIRLACALAARTFSTSDDMQSLEVRLCHVEWIVAFLRKIYSTRAFGYKEFTEATRAVTKLNDPDQIRKMIAAAPFPHDLVEQLLRHEKLDVQDVQDWNGWERPEASAFIALLVRKHALRRDGRFYRKTGAFISMLRSIGEDKDLPGRPDFIAESEF